MIMIMVEKILVKVLGKFIVNFGENIWVNVDVLMIYDVCGFGIIGIFKWEFGENVKVWDKEKIVLILDYYIFIVDEWVNCNVDILWDFV